MQLEAGVKEALDEVLAAGLKDGNEHMVIVRNGQLVMRKDGDDRHIDMADQIADIQSGDVLVHNHPGALNSLSNADVALANRVNAHAIYAITDDGSVYKASNMSPKTILTNMLVMYELEMLSFVTPNVAHAAQSVPGFQSRVNAAHWVNQRMARAGFFKYEFELGKETAEFVSAFESKAEAGRNEISSPDKHQTVEDFLAGVMKGASLWREGREYDGE